MDTQMVKTALDNAASKIRALESKCAKQDKQIKELSKVAAACGREEVGKFVVKVAGQMRKLEEAKSRLGDLEKLAAAEELVRFLVEKGRLAPEDVLTKIAELRTREEIVKLSKAVKEYETLLDTGKADDIFGAEIGKTAESESGDAAEDFFSWLTARLV